MNSDLQAIEQKVFLVEDDTSVREAVSNLLESAGLKVECFDSAESFLAGWNAARAGCVVLDVRLPGMSGMELQSKLADAKPAIPVIVMTGHGDIPMVRKALKAGAIEFLTKPFQDKELLGAIEQALAEDRGRRLTEIFLRSIAARYGMLSERERQVMEMVTDGLINKEIADELNLSLPTVKLYRKQVMEKMQADSLADLVKMRQRLAAARE